MRSMTISTGKVLKPVNRSKIEIGVLLTLTTLVYASCFKINETLQLVY